MLSTRYSRPISFFSVVSSALHLHHHVEEVAHLLHVQYSQCRHLRYTKRKETVCVTRRPLSIAVYVVIRSMVQPSSAPGVGRRCLTPIHIRTSSLPRRTIASSTLRVSRASWNQAGSEAPVGNMQYPDLPNSVREGSLEQRLRELFCFRNGVELDHSIDQDSRYRTPPAA